MLIYLLRCYVKIKLKFVEMDEITQDLISAIRPIDVDKVKKLVEKGANVQENCLLYELIKAILPEDLY